MSTLNGQSISSTYQMLLKTNSATGVSSVLTNVEDGKGNASSLYISNVSSYIDGKLGIGTSAPTSTLHITTRTTQPVLVEDTSGYDQFYVGDTNSNFNVKLGDIDDASAGNDTYLFVDDANNRIINNATYTGLGQTAPSATLHVGDNTGTVKFALGTSTSAFIVGDASNSNILTVDTTNDEIISEGNIDIKDTASFRRSSGRYYLEEFFSTKPATNLTASGSINLGSIADGDEQAGDLDCTGAALGDFVLVSWSIDMTDLSVTASVTAADVVTWIVENNTGGPLDLGAATVQVKVISRNLSNPHFEITGTSASPDDVTFSETYGGLKLQTDGSDNNQVIIGVHSGDALVTDDIPATQTAWRGVRWGTENLVEWECAITTGATITDYAFWAGLKLTNTGVYATDADQAYFVFATDDDMGALTTNANLHFVYSLGTSDYITNLGVAVEASTTYRLRIKIDGDRKVSVFVNDIQYGLTSATTAGGVVESTATTLSSTLDDDTNLLPYVGVQSLGGAARDLRLHYEKISRVLFEG